MLNIFDDFGDQKIQETPQKNCKNACKYIEVNITGLRKILKKYDK